MRIRDWSSDVCSSDLRETALASVRAAIGNGADAAEVQTRAEAAEALLDRAEATISDNASAGATTAFVGALVILLREGLEALLIVIAMMAFLRKAERTEAMPYVHGGWIGADQKSTRLNSSH